MKDMRLFSDIPLEWMIEEIMSLENDADHSAIDEGQRSDVLNSSGHDCNATHHMLARGSGTSTLGLLRWWIPGSHHKPHSSRQQKSFFSSRAWSLKIVDGSHATGRLTLAPQRRLKSTTKV